MNIKRGVDAQKIIDLLGGNAQTAELWQVTPGAVSQWLTNGVPYPFLKFLQAQHPEVLAAASTPRPKKSRASRAKPKDGR